MEAKRTDSNGANTRSGFVFITNATVRREEEKKETGARIARGRSVTHADDDADDDEARLAALTLAIKLNAGLTFSCCVRLSYVDFCMAVE